MAKAQETFTDGEESSFLGGHPLQIISAEDDHTFTLDAKALESVLMRPGIKNKKCVVVSVAGAFRKGKSFLLNFFLRFLAAEGSSSWLGEDNSPLKGFSWRGGSERDTSGILLWSEPFVTRREDGEEVVVLLMDTQGAFDTQSTVRDCATVFALSTMISSVQVYNLSQNVQEDDLQHLQLFTEYGRLALSEDTKSSPFQTLLFLVRDWAYPYEAPYGSEGGEEILKRRLQVSENQHSELQQLRQHIRSCFNNIECFLMPHPGLRVATSPHFHGQLKEVELDFKTLLLQLVPHILSPSQLVVKEINGNEITCADLVQYFKAYMSIFHGDELPEPRSMLQATAEANNLAAVAKARDKYSVLMEKVCGGDQPYVHPNQLEDEHLRCKEAAMKAFNSVKKMGGVEFSSNYAEKLESELDVQFENFKEHNDSKNIFAAARTPATLLTMMVSAYIVSGIFGIFGMTSFANLLMVVMGLCIIMIVIWAYSRYSGDYRDMAMHVDNVAEFVWEKMLRQAYTKATQRGIELATRSQVGGLSRQSSVRTKSD